MIKNSKAADVPPFSRDLVAEQLEIERATLVEANRRQAKANDRADSNRSTGDSKTGRYFVRTLHDPLIEPLRNFIETQKKRGKYMSVAVMLRDTGIEPKVLAFLVAKRHRQ